MSEGYNGWVNYETWNVNLWLDNTEGMYHDLVRLTRRALVANTDEEATDELSPLIREYVTEIWNTEFEGEPRARFGDLSAADGDSLDDVDWDEIAACWVSAWTDEA